MSSKNRAKKYRYVTKMRENMLQTVDGHFQNPLLSDSSMSYHNNFIELMCGF